jgi:hypothetical protein
MVNVARKQFKTMYNNRDIDGEQINLCSTNSKEISSPLAPQRTSKQR